MARKMYYSEEEAAEKLGISVEELAAYVADEKLRVFRDGAKKMYRVDEVDPLAGGGGAEEIELAPADTSAGDALSLADSTQPAEPGKEDTVITAEGISIFDDEDLEIDAADPMADTKVAPALEDQLSSDSIGGGSGLLDLTRESDDTSLGAEILDHIDMDGAIGSSLGAEVVPEPEPFEPRPEAPVAGPAVVEEIDPAAGLFAGFVIACAVVMLIMGAVMVAAMYGIVPGYLATMQKNLTIVLVGAVAVVGVAALAGFFAGKSAAARQMAMRQAGTQV